MVFRQMLLAAGLFSACNAEVFFKETFDGSYADRWTVSAKKDDYGEWKHTAGEFYGDEEANKGLQTSQDAKFYAISAPIPKPFDNKGKSIVVSFQLKDTQAIDCGGGYVKIINGDYDAKSFHGETDYWMMFGPDICGYTKKIHFILNYKGKNLLWKKEPRPVDDRLTHVYTAIVNADGTYEMQIDGEKKESGKLEEDWEFLKPKEIDDPEDKKPSDWADDSMMDDPEDKKPDDWVTEKRIVDAEAKKPDDWDDEEDGEWEPPMKDNPAYKGDWSVKRISNPAYKGFWEAKKIDNPEYEDDNMVYKYDDFGFIGFDLWQVKGGTIFDNVIVCDDKADADAFAAKWKALSEHEKAEKKKEDESKKADDKKKEDEADDDDDDEEDKKESEDM